MDRVEELCGYYTALLRSIYLQHQGAHWKTSGNDFYGNHLLFERIYKTAADNADAAAERFIGLFGTDTMNLHSQAQMIGKVLEKHSAGEPLNSSLEIEKRFLDFSQKFYDVVKKEGKMSLGLDDLLMSIASDREAAVYLLKQALGNTKPESKENMSIEKTIARTRLLQRIKTAQDAMDLQRKLATELEAVVASIIPGTYSLQDITVSFDIAGKKIFGNVKLTHIVPQQKQDAVQKTFTDYAYRILPADMKDFLIGVGFVMIPSHK
jgi:DNA-binding ferritin-like protein